MVLRYYIDLEQGSDEWLALRCGLLTAGGMNLILTPTLKVASNDKERAHVYEMAAQRITKYVEPHYVSDDMLRGHVDEIEARTVYADNFGEVTQCGFITNDKWGFTLGYSPDWLVGDDGLGEAKSRRQKYQMQTLTEFMPKGMIPPDYLLQCQTGLLVSERKWLDFVSYCGGLPMMVIRVYPDDQIQEAILQAAAVFESRVAEKMAIYHAMLSEKGSRLVPTERKIVQEMFV